MRSIPFSPNAGDNDLHTDHFHASRPGHGQTPGLAQFGGHADRQPVADGTASLRIKNAPGACLAKIRAAAAQVARSGSLQAGINPSGRSAQRDARRWPAACRRDRRPGGWRCDRCRDLSPANWLPDPLRRSSRAYGVRALMLSPGRRMASLYILSISL
jgi:hypothetical protein